MGFPWHLDSNQKQTHLKPIDIYTANSALIASNHKITRVHISTDAKKAQSQWHWTSLEQVNFLDRTKDWLRGVYSSAIFIYISELLNSFIPCEKLVLGLSVPRSSYLGSACEGELVTSSAKPFPGPGQTGTGSNGNSDSWVQQLKGTTKTG